MFNNTKKLDNLIKLVFGVNSDVVKKLNDAVESKDEDISFWYKSANALFHKELKWKKVEGFFTKVLSKIDDLERKGNELEIRIGFLNSELFRLSESKSKPAKKPKAKKKAKKLKK